MDVHMPEQQDLREQQYHAAFARRQAEQYRLLVDTMHRTGVDEGDYLALRILQPKVHTLWHIVSREKYSVIHVIICNSFFIYHRRRLFQNVSNLLLLDS